MDTDVSHTPQTRQNGPLEVEEILAGLTKPQAEAVRHTEGPLLVLAGPGSGKTRVITRRIAYLIACGIPAWQILALTFTNKAAAEMRERVTHMLGEGVVARGLTVTTFHALCARLIRKYADIAGLAGITGTFAIYDSDDQTTLVKRAIEDLGLATSNWPARNVLSRISAAKNDLVGPDEFAQQALDFNGRTIAKIYAAYQRALRAANAVDFDDLLLLTAKMLKENQRVREACRDRWQYLLVDEYQDTNKAQFQIAALLSGSVETGRPSPNICVVGDPDQSIYGWRGADISNILQFEKQFPKTTTIALGENFRSTKHIIGAADTLIRNNTQRKHKDLFTANEQGEKAEVVICRDEHHEARLVVDWCKSLRDESFNAGNPLAWKDFAVFYRTNALSRVVEDVLRNEAIPYIIARGTAFYQREEVKHAIAYLRVVANPADDVSLLRIVNTPSRGIGSTTMDRVETLSAERGARVLDTLRTAPESLGLTTRAATAIGKFVKMVDGWAGIHDEGMLHAPAAEGSLAELVERVIRESGLEEMYKKMGEEETERVENLAELVSSAREFEETYDPASDPASGSLNPADDVQPEPSLLDLLRAYLERVTLVADADTVDPAQGAITLMTLHAAKGLEFAGVAMVGLEEGLLPHSRVAESPKELEEERRLCFVGVTRAMKRLLITSARYRTIRGITERTIESRFLHELPRAHITMSDQSGFNEPGWDNLEDRVQRSRESGPRFVPDESSRSSRGKVSGPKDSRGQPLAVGVMVRHPQFGLGRIASITSGQDARARIEFRQVGPKTLVLQYARLERVEG
ncbi:MAG TPA: UvrD-helicase domain-containing protein [Phycisphaerales bacterium]|nr:UvrD-helicase domain-containing protein [Phycisphaerales bacterium]